jgi:hypothetical protein
MKDAEPTPERSVAADLRYSRLRGRRVGDTPTQLPDYVRHRMELCREALRRGHLGGLLVAIDELAAYEGSPLDPTELVDMPHWLFWAMAETLREALDGPVRGKPRGRHSRRIARYRDDMCDFLRAHAVGIAEEEGCRGDRKFERALELLYGSPAGGLSPSTLRDSVDRFRKRRKADPLRYLDSSIFLPEHEPGAEAHGGS